MIAQHLGTTAEKEIDTRVKEALLAEDLDIVLDLRELNSTGIDNFGVFWSKCNKFVTTCTSVHERRHGTTTFMVSIRDLTQQVVLKAHLFHQNLGFVLISSQGIHVPMLLNVTEAALRQNTWCKSANLESHTLMHTIVLHYLDTCKSMQLKLEICV